MNPTRVKPQCAYSWHPVGDSHQKLGEVGSSAQVRVTVCSLHCCMKGDTGVCDPSSRKAWVHTTEAADGLTFMHALFNTFLHSLNKHLLRRHRWRKPRGGGLGGSVVPKAHCQETECWDWSNTVSQLEGWTLPPKHKTGSQLSPPAGCPH